jgi:predicted ArsR family transcriptional regulator
VKNNPGFRTPPESGLGPRPARRGSYQWPLSTSRAALLETLGRQAQPTTLAALAVATGLHPNTLREHLEALIRHRLVRRHRSAPRGRGRPAWLYEAVEDDVRSGPSEYVGLAAALAAAIHRTSDSPGQEAMAAGEGWGHELAQRRGLPRNIKISAARREVVNLLDDFGFAPTYDSRRQVVRLTRCPLLEAAHKYPDVVCGVHLGIVRGALDEHGLDGSHAELLPFSEPGACLLHLRAFPKSDESDMSGLFAAAARRTRQVAPTPPPNPPVARRLRSQKDMARPSRRASAQEAAPASVRAWAKANGHAVHDRGRVPAKVIAAFVAAGSPTD